MTVEITRAQAIRIFEGLGQSGAKLWRQSQMQSALEELHEKVSDDEFIGVTELDNLLDELVAAGTENEAIVIVPEGAIPKERPEETDLSEESDDEESSAINTAVADDEPEDPVDEPEEEVVDEDEPPAVEVPEPEEEIKPPSEPAEPIRKEVPVARKKRSDSNLPHIRPRKGRPYHAGRILYKYGLDVGITPKMIADLERESSPKNRNESLARLKMAWHVIAGYLEESKKTTVRSGRREDLDPNFTPVSSEEMTS